MMASKGTRHTNVVLKAATSPGEKVPGGIGAVCFHRLERVYDVPDRFGHLFLVNGPMGMHEKPFGKWQIKGHKHCREVYGVEPTNPVKRPM